MLCRCTEKAEDLEDLVDLRVAWEERFPSCHFGEDATDAPHVNTSAVLPAAEENLRRAIPESDDFVRVRAERDSECACEAEISDFEIAVSVDEQVLWFEITMEHTMRVTVTNALEKLKGELFDL